MNRGVGDSFLCVGSNNETRMIHPQTYSVSHNIGHYHCCLYFWEKLLNCLELGPNYRAHDGKQCAVTAFASQSLCCVQAENSHDWLSMVT